MIDIAALPPGFWLCPRCRWFWSVRLMFCRHCGVPQP